MSVMRTRWSSSNSRRELKT